MTHVWSADLVAPDEELPAPLLRKEVTLDTGHGGVGGVVRTVRGVLA